MATYGIAKALKKAFPELKFTFKGILPQIFQMKTNLLN